MNYQLWQEISFYLNEIDEKKIAFGNSTITPELIETSRSEISNLIDQLRAGLESQLEKNHASLMLFAIVAAIDEEMQGFNYNHLKVRWTPLQKDFYSAYTAGEVFFKTIDDMLDVTNIPSIVFEVFYFMLKRGFKGKYRDSKTQITKYLDLLKQKIHIHAPAQQKPIEDAISFSKPSQLKKWHYYGLAGFLLICSYLSLLGFSNMDF